MDEIYIALAFHVQCLIVILNAKSIFSIKRCTLNLYIYIYIYIYIYMCVCV